MVSYRQNVSNLRFNLVVSRKILTMSDSENSRERIYLDIKPGLPELTSPEIHLPVSSPEIEGTLRSNKHYPKFRPADETWNGNPRKSPNGRRIV